MSYEKLLLLNALAGVGFYFFACILFVFPSLHHFLININNNSLSLLKATSWTLRITARWNRMNQHDNNNNNTNKIHSQKKMRKNNDSFWRSKWYTNLSIISWALKGFHTQKHDIIHLVSVSCVHLFHFRYYFISWTENKEEKKRNSHSIHYFIGFLIAVFSLEFN